MVSEVCGKICPQCPWRRVAAPGFLGTASFDPWAFASQHVYGTTPLPCHLRVDWEKPDAQTAALSAPLCRGFATFMRNSLTLPKDKAVADLVLSVEPDHEAVFSNYREFHEYHRDPKRIGI